MPLGYHDGETGQVVEPDTYVEVHHQAVGNIAQPDDRVQRKSHKRGAPFLMDGDFLKVTNVSARQGGPGQTYVFSWNKKSYVLEPGESKFVLFEAIVDSMGDPRSMEDEVQRYNDGNGNSGIVMQRSFEMDRLHTRYAVYGSHLDDSRDPKTGEYIAGLLSKTPHVDVETLNGERVVFPATRPDMLPMPLHSADDKKVRTDTIQALDKLEAENAEMRETLNELNDRLDAELRKREGIDS